MDEDKEARKLAKARLKLKVATSNQNLLKEVDDPNEEVARLSGIKVHYMKVLSWMISGAASSLAGLLVTPATNLSPNTLDLILIIGFTAAVVGGLDSLPGAVIGGFALGLVISFVNVYLNPENVFLAILLTLVLVLIVRPQGIMGSKVGRRV